MAPKHIGRYQVKAELDRGGMAVVYLARDPRFDRDVAIKMLPREVRDQPTVRKRFEREAKVIAGLEHPAIVPVYDFGEDDRQPYLVMRYMTGGSLADRLDQRLSLRDATRIVTRVASALDEAHDRGVVHRDLKPGNILFDLHGEAFLSDFGIVKMPESGATSANTGSLVLGTPAYMSPEQAMGKTVDRRTDIYALGAVLYEMLTGMPPYIGPTPMSIAMKHVVEPVPTVKPMRPDLPDDIEDVISTAMAKNPDLRYETAGDMAVALNRIVQRFPMESATVPNTRNVIPEPGTTAVLPDTDEFELPEKIEVMLSTDSVQKITNSSAASALPGRAQLMASLPLLIGLVVTVALVALGISASLARLQAMTPTPRVRPAVLFLTTPTYTPRPTVTVSGDLLPTPTAIKDDGTETGANSGSIATATAEERIDPAVTETPEPTPLPVILKAIENVSNVPVISLREGPGTNFRILRAIPAGTRFTAVARAANVTDGLTWYLVILADGEPNRGWVFNRSVQQVSGDVLRLPFSNDYPDARAEGPAPVSTSTRVLGGPATVTPTPIEPIINTPTPQATTTTIPTPTASPTVITATPSVTPTPSQTPTPSITPSPDPNATITPVPF